MTNRSVTSIGGLLGVFALGACGGDASPTASASVSIDGLAVDFSQHVSYHNYSGSQHEAMVATADGTQKFSLTLERGLPAGAQSCTASGLVVAGLAYRAANGSSYGVPGTGCAVTVVNPDTDGDGTLRVLVSGDIEDGAGGVVTLDGWFQIDSLH